MQELTDEKMATDSAFHDPADRLIFALREYYQRIQGHAVTDKEVEEQALRIIRSRL